MGLYSFLGEPRGPRYEAWSAWSSASSLVERARKPVFIEKWKAVTDAGEEPSEYFHRIHTEMDEEFPYPKLEDFKPEDYIGDTTATDNWARIVRESGGLKPLPHLGTK